MPRDLNFIIPPEEPKRHRLSAELTEYQATRLQAILPRGWQKPLFSAIVDNVIELYDKHGFKIIDAIVSKEVAPEVSMPKGALDNGHD